MAQNVYLPVGVISSNRGTFGAGMGAINMNDVQCNGTENGLIDCRYTSNSYCTHNRDAGVYCGITLG